MLTVSSRIVSAVVFAGFDPYELPPIELDETFRSAGPPDIDNVRILVLVEEDF